LEELAWSLNSPLWMSLNKQLSVPSSQDVSLGSVEGYSSRLPNVPLAVRYPTSPLKQLGAKRRLSFDDDEMFVEAKRKIPETDERKPMNATTLFFRKVFLFYYLFL
uniref:AGC-kinase C-terminal domain-containing protein n=1 Tax=Gongylonema pulchrum TaxID=637853 RepID=A0A183F038_9BILA